jgi:predicted phage tail protein
VVEASLPDTLLNTAGVRVEQVPDPRKLTKVAAGGGGGKGGGGGQQQAHQPQIAPNTLRSLATVRILEVLSEGPVFGASDAPISMWQAIYLDNTPVVDAAGNAQFFIKEGYFREGWPSQDAIPGYPMGEAPFSVGVQVHTGTPVIRAFNTPISAVRYILQLPALFSQVASGSNTGDVTPASVTYAFDIQVDGGDWVNVMTEQISGKTMSPYQRAVRVAVPYTTGTLAGRVVRFDPEPAPGVNNNLYWSAYVEITDGQIAYDDTCVAAMTLDAQQFSNPPTRGYLLDGLLLDVPSNYDSRARTYDGDWDGTFKQEWTNNPAWVLYGLLVNERWGLGRFVDVDAVDKWSFYEAARYNDELVPDGSGGLEPRWTCNCVINTRQDAYTVLNAVASSMLALLYWSNGTVFIAQDRRSGEPTRLFTPADVELGLFDYQGTDYRSRWTAVAVGWNDPADFYNAAVELVQDQALVAQQGYRDTQQVAFGCTSRGQAQRFGRWNIYTNQFETEVVTFRIGLENADVRPGEIVAISDPSRVGARLGGRLLDDPGADTVTLDALPAQIGANPSAWTLYVVTGSAAEGEPVTVIACPVQAVIGGAQLRIIGKTVGMVAGCNWLAASSAAKPTHWRVASIADQGAGKYEVLATEHHEEKFDYVDDGVLIPPPLFSLVPTGALIAPSDLSKQEYIYLDGAGMPQFGVVMSWQPPPDPRVVSYTLEMTGPGGDYRRFFQISTVAQDVPAMRQGEWLAVLRGFDALGRRTLPISLQFTPVGLSAKPLAPTGLYITPQGPTCTLTWVATGEIDVVFYWIKWSPLTDGTATWESATTSIARVTRNTTQTTTPTRAGTFMIKTIDALGQESDEYESAILTDQITNAFALAVEAEQPTWAGDLGAHWHRHLPELLLPPPAVQEDIPVGVFPGDRSLAVNSSPTRLDVYGFANSLDLGIVCNVSMVALIEAYGSQLGQVMALWQPLASQAPLAAGISGNMAAWVPLASAKPLAIGRSTQWDAHIEVRVSQDGVAFNDWTPLKSALITGRAFEWRLIGTIFDFVTTLRMQRAEVDAQVPPRTLAANDALLDGTGHLTITYARDFLATPSVQLTARQSLSPGGNIVITESDAHHFKVEHRNAAGAATPGGSIDYFVEGYGGYS